MPSELESKMSRQIWRTTSAITILLLGLGLYSATAVADEPADRAPDDEGASESVAECTAIPEMPNDHRFATMVQGIVEARAQSLDRESPYDFGSVNMMELPRAEGASQELLVAVQFSDSWRGAAWQKDVLRIRVGDDGTTGTVVELATVASDGVREVSGEVCVRDGTLMFSVKAWLDNDPHCCASGDEAPVSCATGALAGCGIR